MNEKQTRLVIDLMARLGLLNRAADAHCDAEKVPLELPQYPGLLAKAQYRLPLLGLTPVTGPVSDFYLSLVQRCSKHSIFYNEQNV